jgi:hypothetical protein
VLVDSGYAAGDFNSTAVACCYLQRHACELALKALIDKFHAVESSPPPAEVKRLTSSHNLRELLGDVQAAHQRATNEGCSYPAVPTELWQLVDEITNLEKGADERYRYAYVKRKDTKQTRLEASFEVFKEQVLPIGALQDRLERVFHDVFETDTSLAAALDRDYHPDDPVNY